MATTESGAGTKPKRHGLEGEEEMRLVRPARETTRPTPDARSCRLLELPPDLASQVLDGVNVHVGISCRDRVEQVEVVHPAAFVL